MFIHLQRILILLWKKDHPRNITSMIPPQNLYDNVMLANEYRKW